MSLLSGATHLIGDVAAPVLNANASVNSLFGNQSAATKSRQMANAISDPNQVFSGSVSSLLNPNQGSFSTVQPLPTAPQGNQLAATNNGTNGNNQNSGAYDQQAAQTAQDKANALFGIDSGLTSANDALGRLGQQEQIGNGNIDNEYQSAIDQLMGSKAIAQRNYDTSRTGQVNDYVTKQADNTMQGRNWLDSARRTLGANGAGGGSAARYQLPFEAQQQVAQGNSAAQATNNKNLVALDTNYADTQDKFNNAQADTIRQRDQGRNDLQSKIADQRANLLSTIAQLTGQKTIASGGDYNSAAAAAKQYTSQIPALLDRINSLSATPHIQAQQVTTTAPTLDQYNYARPQAAPTPVQDTALTNPIIAAILGSAQQQDPNKLQFA